MKLRTEIEPLKMRGEIDYNSRIVMVGSCFTDEVGERLRRELFDVAVNPVGTIYNPLSISQEIRRARKAENVGDLGIIESSGRWVSFLRHSSFSAASCEDLQSILKHNIVEFRELLGSATHLIITLGSAIGFRQRATDTVVVNCHKQPVSEFYKVEFSVGECVVALTEAIRAIRAINPRLKVILTVSPVRHAGYGLMADRLSKSTLIVACHELCCVLSDCVYFPSYEALVDDLRDYRFYADDLAHPSRLAVDYIYNLFRESFMTNATIDLASRWAKLTSRLGHRFNDPGAEDSFRNETVALARQLADLTPGGDNVFKRFKECN